MPGFMPMGDFRVTYTNGETALAVSNFLGLVEVERRWPTETPPIEAIGYAVWCYLGKPTDDFDEWLATVHTIEGTAEETPVEVPTQPAVGAA